MDFALEWFNIAVSTEQMWRDDARGAALFDAGVEDVLLPAARGAKILESLAMGGPIGDLADHSARMPPGALPVDVVVRDATTATALLGVVGSSNGLDAIRGFADARGEARMVAATDWAAQYKLGLRLVDLVTKGGSN